MEKGSNDRLFSDFPSNAYTTFGPVYVKTIIFRVNMYIDNVVQNFIVHKKVYIFFSWDAIFLIRKRKIEMCLKYF